MAPVKATLKVPGFEGQQLWVNPDDAFVSAKLLEQGVWEDYETALFNALLKPDSVVLDIGANLGYYSFLAAQLAPQGKVFAFEPEPLNFTLLEKNTTQFNNLTSYNVALGHQAGELALFKSEENPGDHQSYDRGEGRESVKVDVCVADELLDSQSRIDLIKIDVQGAECSVFHGLDKLIRRSLPQLAIICEFYPKGLKHSGFSAMELYDLLLSYGLQLKVIDHLKHRLWDFSEQEIRAWIKEVDDDPANEGFMNLLLIPGDMQERLP